VKQPTTIEITHTTVFALTPEGGNPGPVVVHGDRLTASQMQAVASALGLDTVFVLAPRDRDADIALRYFVPNGEMGMSVHATIAAITVLLTERALPPVIRVETRAGTFSVWWKRQSDGSQITVEQFAAQFSSVRPPAAEVARALRLPLAAIQEMGCPIEVVSTSRAKLLVPVRDHMVLDGLSPDFDELWDLCERHASTGLYAFTLQTRAASLSAEARQYPLRAGFQEDAATGVAASALGAYLIRHALLGARTDGVQTVRIGQGFAMGRPSVIEVDVHLAGEEIVRTEVRGKATISATQLLTLPE
jgi:trans-2,3-dihydro-3-hydroxyanthranilate isomerase